jgi:hypothetical protein
VHGTAAYDITTTGEPAGARPQIWDALNYESANYMQHLNAFVQSEGRRYQDLLLASDQIFPRKAPGSPEDGLDGWSYMMRTAEKDFALVYFENKAVLPTLKGFAPGKTYTLTWFNPMNGEWQKAISITADGEGTISVPSFPQQERIASRDWAAKIVL